jgi:hypothetical protein
MNPQHAPHQCPITHALPCTVSSNQQSENRIKGTILGYHMGITRPNFLIQIPKPDSEAKPSASVPSTRPRSARGHVPALKAQSEEPKPYEKEKSVREPRRHSVFTHPTSALPAPTRASRRKPPPKGDISASGEGQKTVTNVKRAQGNKHKKKKKTDEDSEPAEDIDPNEPKYCICDDVSYGSMISCDNNVSLLFLLCFACMYMY